MIIQKFRILNQINRWHNMPLIELWFDLESETPIKTARIKQFFKTNLPHLTDLESLTDPSMVLGQSMILLQQAIGIDVTHYESKQDVVLVNYKDAFVIDKLIELVQQLMEPISNQYETFLNIKTFYEHHRLGPSTGHIVQAAIQRNIPYFRLNHESLIQFGHGIKQRRIQAAITDSSSVISDFICQDKMLTKKVLYKYGIIMPEGEIVNDVINAKYAADNLGYPVVIKPLEGNQGKGVTTNIQNEEQLRLAFAIAKKHDENILIEKFIAGQDYRLLVVGNKLIAAAKRTPPCVRGDGIHSIQELILKLNQDPARLEGHNGVLSQIIIDDIMLNHLSNLGYTLDSVLKCESSITLRNNANLSSGGMAIDVTDDVHPFIAIQAVKIAQVLHLDICGIDLVCQDISKPLTKATGAFIEVNLAPGLRMHIAPSHGTPRNVGVEVMKVLYPNDDGRIPIIAITGTNGKTTSSKIIAHLLSAYKHHVGLCNTEGVFINHQKIISGDCAGPYSAETILMHPRVDACVFETARGGILRKGLAFDEANVAVFTNIGHGDHLGIDKINTPEDIYHVKSTLLKTVQKGVAVLNADDPILMSMTSDFPGKKILFSMDSENIHIKAHDNLNQAIIFYDASQKKIILKKGNVTHHISIENIKIAHQGKVKFQLMNLMASIAAIWGLEKDLHLIHHALESLASENELVPGRFNILSTKKHHIIVDYGHNLDAIVSLITAIDHIPAKRRVLMTSTPGDRQNSTIIKQMQILADHFDEAIIYQEENLRSRTEGEIFDVISQGLNEGKRLNTPYYIPKEIEALKFTLNLLEQGDLCLMILDQHERCHPYLEMFIKE